MIIGFSPDFLKIYAQKPKALLSYSLSLCSRLFLRYCITYLFLHNQVPQDLVAWDSKYYLPDSVDEEFGCGLAMYLWLEIFRSFNETIGWGKDTSEGLIRGGRASLCTPVVTGRIQVLTGGRTEGIFSSLAVGWKRLSVPSFKYVSIGHSPSFPPSKWAREYSQRWKTLSFVTSPQKWQSYVSYTIH